MKQYVVVDTDAFSILWQNRGKSAQLAPHLSKTFPVLSFTTVAEAHFGAVSANWGERRMKQLDAAIKPYIVVPYSIDMAILWGKLKHQARKRGHPLGANAHSNDLWICATAMLYDAPLLTLNRQHYEDMPGLNLLG